MSWDWDWELPYNTWRRDMGMPSAADANRDPFLTCSCPITLWHPWEPPYLLMHTYLVYSI